MRKIFSVAAAAALMALSACDKAATEPQGVLTGTWSYRATGFKMWPGPDVSEWACSIETRIVVRQENHELEGVSDEAQYTCTHTDGRVSVSTWPAGVVRGEVQDGRVHFSNAGGWHSFGEIEPDRVEGYLQSYGGLQGQPETLQSGEFVLERISHQGYGGPRA